MAALRRNAAALVHRRVLSTATSLRRALSAHTLPASGVREPFTVAVLGAPVSLGQPLDGVELAPAALRAGGLRRAVTGTGWRWADRGDVAAPAPRAGDPRGDDHARNALAVGRACEAIADAVAADAAAGHFVLTLGGDHSVAMGSLAGVLRARPSAGVLWVDAHADLNTPDASPSGNMHGMPLAFLLRLVQPAGVPGCAWLASAPPLDPSALAYVGLRDLDAAEKAAIRRLGIFALTMHEVDRWGIGRCAEMALAHLTAHGPRPLHLSLDIDAVEPALAPSTGTAVPGGLSYREAHYLCEAAAETGLLGSMDVVEVNPLLRPDAAAGHAASGAAPARSVPPAADGGAPNATVALAVELVASALGKTILPVAERR